jgi:hypothetical protein
MAKSKREQEKPASEEALMESVKESFKRLLNTPPETHKELVERRRGHVKPMRNPPPKKA